MSTKSNFGPLLACRHAGWLGSTTDVSGAIVQALLLAVSGAAVLSITVLLTRRGALSLRFGVGWLVLSLVVMLGAAVGALDFVRPVARFLQLTPTGLVVGGVAAFLLIVCLQLSSALSYLERVSRRLLQETALLEQRVAAIEREQRRCVAQQAGPSSSLSSDTR